MIVSLFLLLACTGKPDASGDSGCVASVWYLDEDGDGYGAGTPVEACATPAAHVAEPGDCDDADAAVNPGAEELCDGIDNDCDGALDPPDESWLTDQDGDGWGGTWIDDCAVPDDWTAVDGDCDDNDPGVHPDAEDTWYDGIDSDCDGASDYDADGDGYEAELPSGTDCDDTNDAIHPDAEDVCGDDVDSDCDGEDTPCAPLGEWDLGDLSTAFWGSEEGDWLGWSIYIGDDADADGYPELWLGAPKYDIDHTDSNEGAVYAVEVAVRGTLAAWAAANTTIIGEVEEAYLGGQTPATADFDGDGVLDLVVADVRVAAGDGAPSGRGAVFFGPLPEVLDFGDADMTIDGDAVSQAFPDAALRPLTGPEGEALLAIAAPWSNTAAGSRGVVFLVDSFDEAAADLSLVETTISSTEPAIDQFGKDLEVADLDGDGVEELVTSIMSDRVLPGGRGKSAILVYSGPFSGARAVEDYDGLLTTGPPSDGVQADNLGRDIDVLPDLDGDGLPDLLAGAYLTQSAGEPVGAAYVLTGPFEGERLDLDELDPYLRVEGGDGYEYLGSNVTGAGDMDADGTVDLAVMADRSKSDHPKSAALLVWYGPEPGVVTAASADLAIEDTDIAGCTYDCLAGGRDLDQDGFDDLAFLAWDYPHETEAGAVFILFGGPPE